MTDFLSLREVQDHLASFIPSSDKPTYKKLKFSQLEGAFIGRTFIAYKAKGVNGDAPNRPQIVTRFRVTDFCSNPETGSEAEIKDMSTGERVWVGHTPTRLWDYDLFMYIPPNVTLRWTMTEHEGKTKHTLLFGLVTRMADRSETYADGKLFCLTPKRMWDLYPDLHQDTI